MPLVSGLCVPLVGSLWHKRAGVASLWEHLDQWERSNVLARTNESLRPGYIWPEGGADQPGLAADHETGHPGHAGALKRNICEIFFWKYLSVDSWLTCLLGSRLGTSLVTGRQTFLGLSSQTSSGTSCSTSVVFSWHSWEPPCCPENLPDIQYFPGRGAAIIQFLLTGVFIFSQIPQGEYKKISLVDSWRGGNVLRTTWRPSLHWSSYSPRHRTSRGSWRSWCPPWTRPCTWWSSSSRTPSCTPSARSPSSSSAGAWRIDGH